MQGKPMDTLEQKAAKLRDRLDELGRVAVAFSGGVDSTLLLRVAHDTLGDQVVAFTLSLHSTPARESDAAREFCQANGIRQVVIEFDELSIPGFRENPPDRCYWCKRNIFTTMLATADEQGFGHLVEGSNVDDLDDYRPGSRAIRELGVASPLLEAGFTKADVRALSQRLGLPTWNKPSAACLASRFAYGEPITDAGLARVDAAETFLRDMGFGQARVRVHGTLARIEVSPDRIEKLAAEPLRSAVLQHLKELGFSYITLDLAGYRTGSMNEALTNTR